MSLVWSWMNKRHKYKKDRSVSVARPLTALTYAMNRSNIERIFYSVVGFESVYTKSEKRVRQQLKETIPVIFPSISENDADLFYTLRSDFAHGDIEFPDYYNTKYYWNNMDDVAQKAISLLIMTVRELVLNNAIKIRVDDSGNIMFLKHQIQY